MENKNPLDILLDSEQLQNIELYDESNRAVEFEQVAIIPLRKKIYAILKPVKKFEDLGDNEALVFLFEKVDDEECLVLENDVKILDKVFKEYHKLIRKDNN